MNDDSFNAPKPSRRRDTVDATALAWLARRDRGLSAGEKLELQAWLSEDPSHGAALGRYGVAWATLDRPRKIGTTEQVLAAARRHSSRRRGLRLRTFGVLATVTLVAIFVARNVVPKPSIASANQVALLVPRQDVMPDGSVAQIKDGSEMTLDFSPMERHVRLLRGAALFEVVKDAGRPFVVAAGAFSIRAVGTAFSVQVTADGVQVIVTEGKVAVERRPVDGESVQPDGAAYLEKGQRIDLEPRMAKLPAPVAISAREISGLLAWREPRLEFSGMPLGEAVALLNQSNSLKLRVGDSAISGIQISGVFRTANVEDFVLVLERGFGVKAERRTTSEIVLRKAP